MFRDGPDVSFSGSPTVSPITAATWQADPLPPRERACSDAPAYMRANSENEEQGERPGEGHAHKATAQDFEMMHRLTAFVLDPNFLMGLSIREGKSSAQQIMHHIMHHIQQSTPPSILESVFDLMN